MQLKKFIYWFAVSVLACSCTGAGVFVPEAGFDYAGRQLRHALAHTDSLIADSPEKFAPRTVADGKLVLVPGWDWTSGFFPGELWYMYEFTGDEFWKNEAVRFTEKLEKQQFNRGTHDLGFMMFNSYGHGYRLTGNPEYREILINSAESLASRFNPAVGCIRSWDHNRDKWQYPVIVDNMMNLELLYWAAEETGDPKYKEIADSHADITMKNHFREDFSSYHVVDYDIETGEVLKKQTHQGYNDESSWARGQAWGLYGFTSCYRLTGNIEYLAQAEHIAEYIFSAGLPEDMIFYWDFNDPGIPDVPRDASAAAITACALYELSIYNEKKASDYRLKADTIVENLYNGYISEAGENFGFLLLHSTGAKTFEIDVPIVYADYYFVEALMRRHKLEQGKHLFE